MTDSPSPLLAAATPADDFVPHVVQHTSFGSPSHTGGSSLSEIPVSTSHAESSANSSEDDDAAARNLAAYGSSMSPVSEVHSQNVVPFYRRPQFYSTLLQTFSQNFLFPFINGVMLGFGEICANEIAFRMGWFGVRNLPIYSRRTTTNPLGTKNKYETGIDQRSKKTKTDDGREVEIDEGNSKITDFESSTSAAMM